MYTFNPRPLDYQNRDLRAPKEFRECIHICESGIFNTGKFWQEFSLLRNSSEEIGNDINSASKTYSQHWGYPDNSQMCMLNKILKSCPSLHIKGLFLP